MASNEEDMNNQVPIQYMTVSRKEEYIPARYTNEAERKVAKTLQSVMTKVCHRINQLELAGYNYDTTERFYNIHNFIIENHRVNFHICPLTVESLKHLKQLIQSESSLLATMPAAFFSKRADTLYNCINDIENGIIDVEKSGPGMLTKPAR